MEYTYVVRLRCSLYCFYSKSVILMCSMNNSCRNRLPQSSSADKLMAFSSLHWIGRWSITLHMLLRSPLLTQYSMFGSPFENVIFQFHSSTSSFFFTTSITSVLHILPRYKFPCCRVDKPARWSRLMVVGGHIWPTNGFVSILAVIRKIPKSKCTPYGKSDMTSNIPEWGGAWGSSCSGGKIFTARFLLSAIHLVPPSWVTSP